MGDSFGDSLHELPTGTRHFEQALREDRPPSAFSVATPGTLPATQGQRSKGRQKTGITDTDLERICQAELVYQQDIGIRRLVSWRSWLYSPKNADELHRFFSSLACGSRRHAIIP